MCDGCVCACDGVWCMFEDICVMGVYVHVMVCGACARVCVNNACMCSVWGCIYMYVCDGVCDCEILLNESRWGEVFVIIGNQIFKKVVFSF